MADLYTYTKLSSEDSFRVLEILPGERDSMLCCKIFETRRKDQIKYEAISYTWGAPIFSHRLTEVTSGTIIHITENLYDALQVFRLEDDSRLLWADAVCIDQSSGAEKVHQVRPQMGEIYREAAIALVWLGKEDA
ncbi:HET-domain-containing protein, partial [Lophiostoma macrostomum CBS 122681]